MGVNNDSLTSAPHLAEGVDQETLQRLATRWSRVGSPMAFCFQLRSATDDHRGGGRSWA
jgi:hypothetical protein